MYQYSEIDQRFARERVAEFRDQTRRRLAGQLSEDDFRPLRLMNGLYLQRHAYMLRVAVPYGLISTAQMRTFGYISERYDRGFGHVTTRQNLQFNWLRLEDVPDILHHLAEVEMTGIQTSGNCVRNITSDPYAGVATDELFDPRPYCEIIRQYKELHPEFMYLPRKFKIAVSSGPNDRAATGFHDIGLRARLGPGGQHGFEVLAGGGMGRTPRIALTIFEFVEAKELLTCIEALLRVYNLHGRRDNKYKARIKITVREMGLETFRAAAQAEWDLIAGTNDITPERVAEVAAAFDVTEYEDGADTYTGHQGRAASDAHFAAWLKWNVKPHKVPGYHIVYASLKSPRRPPGDVMTHQFYALADLADRYSQGLLQATYNQNVLFRDIRSQDLEALYEALGELDFATPNIDTITDLICCPGLDFCSLANAESIGIADRIIERFEDLDELYELGKIHINLSGCINACGHHHSGHIGVLGIDKRGRDFYQVSVGGHAGTNEALPARVGDILGPAVPPDDIVELIERVLECYASERRGTETFIETVARVGVEPFRHAAYPS